MSDIMKQLYTNSRFEYKGLSVHDSYCEVEVLEHNNKFLVILTEPPEDDSGTSVTNACENIATKLFNTLETFSIGTLEKDIVWIEHYPQRGYHFPLEETFDLITFKFNKGVFFSPQWKHIGENLTEEKMKDLLK